MAWGNVKSGQAVESTYWIPLTAYNKIREEKMNLVKKCSVLNRINFQYRVLNNLAREQAILEESRHFRQTPVPDLEDLV